MASFFSSSKTAGTSTIATDADLANDIIINNPADDSISDIAFSPQQDFLFSASSWDNKVRIWDIQGGNPQGKAQYEHSAPVLCTRWSFDGTKVASGGCDNVVKVYDLNSGQNQQVGSHDSAVQSLRFVQCGPTNAECLVTGSWDKTLKYWDLRQPQPISTVMMPDRVYAMDSKQQLLVVGTAERNIVVINLTNPTTIFKTVQSPLKMQTRTVACYNSGDGYAIGSVEGRIAIRYVDEEQQRKLGFSFKCHRQTKTNRSVGSSSQASVYAVNSISFHPGYGTFVSAGSDGSFHFWDKNQRHRLKGYPAQNGSIPICNFNRQGSLLAYAISYDWSRGYTGNRQDYPNVIRIHPTTDAEVREKQK
ncbi:hypothetical protein Kpol_1045p33 [Vanderwaltozyma polyspora DSM 70294]|uniref:Anaphase-promoting complex subunit 4 WD40 domain-containing protein n=1 Tax=Vanderwaltozyma polyspora (strain ATCC 22028 / DSM 70294 / BCRC 21397 / CBS 2163 / NBRC 10782 / NRRL Y-8283 / UCD 57-17) TaxID=436907 RepID=A7TI40_VANPO|nr:uncharacterized protein Kpol_1045p33 [Vanderwaltozyma polyspora DSM 70294]EDO18047.1 hypothetical protein Kpol_1045p33 [Vanderwaltozyma polyspora DSM 70294]